MVEVFMKYLIGFLSLIVLTSLAFYIINILDSRYSFTEMDLDKSGFISFSEADYVSSSGERIVKINGKSCTEYFAYKDGLTIKTKCG
ncbi:hypothetical protein NQU47_03225 [Pseudoalteromonas distincta]|uniref:EF-hand domain-containing protein n=1 Tax=Pseudoalteromonas issachenkonii TaxID=152297 RepID=A0ABU9H1P6_9GAMM|nr:hypothetical protein [Pseudoalteromonas distincta]MDC3211569.1 hypothetical protein [Pseudoalteromonas distincta]